jgi:ribonuclease HII
MPVHVDSSKKLMSQSELDFDLSKGPDFSSELKAKKAGYWPVAGLDEAGRGPLAGPVVAAAVILDPDNIPDGLNDSKKLTSKKRELLFDQIMTTSHVSICSNSAKSIDQSDIRKASLDAMRKAFHGLEVKAEFALVDGRDIPDGLNANANALVKGDGRSLSIAAASIIAKVTRDRMMEYAGELYPEYGFEKHAGYGTKAHREAIEEFGPCPIHRFSFKPIRKD